MKASYLIKKLSLLVSGNMIARIVPLLTLPILSRVYRIEDFAILGVFTALVSIINTLTSGNYEYAIIIPEKSEEAIRIKWVAVILCLCCSLIVFILLILFSSSLQDYLGVNNVKFYIFFIPITLISNKFYQVQEQWAVRNQYYKSISGGHILNSVGTAGAQILLGTYDVPVPGLVVGTITGNLIVSIFLSLQFSFHEGIDFKFISFKSFWNLLVKYKDFPTYRMPGIFMNKLQDSIPVLIFNTSFSKEFLGFYSMAKKMLSLPINVIGRSVGNVFAAEASKEIQKTNFCKISYKVSLRFLVITGLLGVGIVFFVIPQIIPFLLGEEWLGIKIVIQILSLRLLLSYISSPLSRIFVITRNLKMNFIYQVIQAGIIIISLYLVSIFENEIVILLTFSIVSSLVKFFYIAIGYKLSTKPVKMI